ncbi:hypothetical protein UCRPC4_g01976 [Phaeomoniella chlamydospora]|uniref:DUF985 domain-containing protein n=1 Tax=Phaeomoniella chlamydospora TaxID=158046 RepID=A0A0G2H981_PHACM|nr:hypothetical protein UCRPC4_g01976 [Phaeomoniella chlamydospora]
MTVKKRGRPKKVVDDALATEEVAAVGGKAIKPRTRAKANRLETDETEQPVKTRARTKLSKTSDLSESVEDVLKQSRSKSASKRVKDKSDGTDAKSTSSKVLTDMGPNDTTTTTSSLVIEDPANSIDNAASPVKQIDDSISGESPAPEIIIAARGEPHPAESTLPASLSSSGATIEQAAPANKDQTELQEQAQSSKTGVQTPLRPEQTDQVEPSGDQTPSKILEALAIQHQNTSTSNTTAPFPFTTVQSNVSSATGPKFSASASLNSPSMSRNQKPLSSRLPKPGKFQLPLDTPTGPPNPGQIPLTPEQIENIRSSKQYKTAQAKWTRALVAMPIVIVTSYMLWERYRDGTLLTGPQRPNPNGPSATDSPSSILSSEPDSSPSKKSGGVKPRIIPDYELQPTVMIDTSPATAGAPGQKQRARIETFTVGPDIEAGEKLQWIVEGGKFKASFLLPDDDDDDDRPDSSSGGPFSANGCLITEVVTPGFEYSDHDFMTRQQLEDLVDERDFAELSQFLRKGERPTEAELQTKITDRK